MYSYNINMQAEETVEVQVQNGQCLVDYFCFFFFFGMVPAKMVFQHLGHNVYCPKHRDDRFIKIYLC